MKEITKKEILEKTENKESFVVQYSASWCGPCRVLTPILENVGYSKNIDVYKFDISSDPEFAKEKSIMSIPHVEFYAKGEVVGTKTGLASRDLYEEQVDIVLGS